jgi:uncharacterized lipoprotein YbaY
MTRIWNPRFACCCIVALSVSIALGCATHAPQTTSPATMPLTAHAAPAAADIQSSAVAPEKPKPGRLTGTVQLSPTATFPIDAEVRITARYFDGDPVVIGQTFNDVRKWPIHFELQLPEDMAHYDFSIRISARAELDGRTILVTEEKHCSFYRGHFSKPLDLILMPAVE